MAATSGLASDLGRWNGKSTDDIRSVYAQYHTSRGFLDEVVSLLENKACERGASWLLKHYFDQGGSAGQKQSQAICRSAPGLTDWAARLHMLQCLPSLDITPGNQEVVESFVRRGLCDHNKFVRAWSYNGLHELARRFPALQAETRAVFDMALRDEAPSVKARIRNILEMPT